MIKKSSTFTAKPNLEITKTDLVSLTGSQVLESVVLNDVHFVGGITLNDLHLHDNNDLSSLSIAGSEGLVMPAVYGTSPTIRPVPKSWAALTKLKTLSFQNCGFSSVHLGNFVKDLAERVGEGLGTAVLTAKVLTINGVNAPLLVSDATIAAAKATLVSKGWTVTHN